MATEDTAYDDGSGEGTSSDWIAAATGATSSLLDLAKAFGPQSNQPQAGGAGASGPGSSQLNGGSGGSYIQRPPMSTQTIVLIAVGSLVALGVVVLLVRK